MELKPGMGQFELSSAEVQPQVRSMPLSRRLMMSALTAGSQRRSSKTCMDHLQEAARLLASAGPVAPRTALYARTSTAFARCSRCAWRRAQLACQHFASGITFPHIGHYRSALHDGGLPNFLEHPHKKELKGPTALKHGKANIKTVEMIRAIFRKSPCD